LVGLLEGVVGVAVGLVLEDVSEGGGGVELCTFELCGFGLGLCGIGAAGWGGRGHVFDDRGWAGVVSVGVWCGRMEVRRR